MARGDMTIEKATFGGGVEILNRPPYEAVAMTIDFSGATGSSDGFKKDAASGEVYAPAGVPIDKDGKPVKGTPFTNAVGILLHDVHPNHPQGAILTQAYINVKKAKESCGIDYDKTLVDAMVNAGNRIRFEEADSASVLVGDLSAPQE